jgi:protoporphyrinogen/coproporphyrinogen III oxidase
MIGRLQTEKKNVSIIGAGISGLLAAYFLNRSGYEVEIFEARSSAGGLIQSEHTEFGLVESAAHSLLMTSEVKNLFLDLGVEYNEVSPNSKARYIVRNGKLTRFPLKFGETFELLRKALNQNHTTPETMEEWAQAYLGQAGLDYLINPFLTGIYASPPEKLSVKAAFPQLTIARNKSALRHLWELKKKRANEGAKMVAPKYGLGDLTTKLEAHLRRELGSRFQTDIFLDQLPNTPNRILCTPAHESARLIQSIAPRSAKLLRAVEYAPLVSVTVFAKKSNFRREPKGVGVLLPAREKRDVLGILFNSSSFSDRVKNASEDVSLTVLLGGSLSPKILDIDDPGVRKIIERELNSLFGFNGELLQIRIHRWPKAVPTYSPQLLGVWDQLRLDFCSELGNLVFGNYTGEVSLRGMIQSASAL